MRVQQLADVREEAAWNGQMVRNAFTRGAAAFLTDRTYAFLAARDVAGLLWCSVVSTTAGSLFSLRSPTELVCTVFHHTQIRSAARCVPRCPWDSQPWTSPRVADYA